MTSRRSSETSGIFSSHSGKFIFYLNRINSRKPNRFFQKQFYPKYSNFSTNRLKSTMEIPFNWSHPARPRYSSNMRGIPVQSIHQKPAGIKPATKVVQIPVHSVSSNPDRSSVSASTTQLKPDETEVPERSASALRIQKVFRGYLVRKNVKRIMSIRKEVDEIERKLLCGETAELIRRNERERLRVNETLMSLLFKLDSIRGVDSGVRECRKDVIKKAISLQEKVDSIVSRS